MNYDDTKSGYTELRIDGRRGRGQPFFEVLLEYA